MTRAADLAKLIAGGGSITVDDNATTLSLVSTDADANSGPVQVLYRNSSSPADSDLVGEMHFRGRNDNSQDVEYVTISTRMEDVSDGTEDGKIILKTMVDGTARSRIEIDHTDVVINQDSIDSNFRVESNNQAGMIFVDAGNDRVGIGTVSPNHDLHLHKSTSDGNFLLITNSTTGSNSNDGAAIGLAADETLLIYHQESSDIRFGTGATERMRVDSSGLLRIGNTSGTLFDSSSATGIVAGTSLQVATDGSTVAFFNRLSSNGQIVGFYKDGTQVGGINTEGGDLAIGTGDVGLQFLDGSEIIAPFNMSTNSRKDNSIDLGGGSERFDDIFATNGTIQTSDKNEKNTIEESDLGLDFVNRLSPKSYKFNNKTRTHYGLIAQDVETVLGDIKKDATQFAGFCKDDISEKQDGSEYRYGLRYHEFISPMIQAIKDLKAEVDTLKAKVATLESK